MPAAAAASIPFRPPVWGTTTLFAFLMMLPLAFTSTRAGSASSSSRARAAASAMAMGSVHPIAATSSSSRMATYRPYRSSVRSMKHSLSPRPSHATHHDSTSRMAPRAARPRKPRSAALPRFRVSSSFCLDMDEYTRIRAMTRPRAPRSMHLVETKRPRRESWENEPSAAATSWRESPRRARWPQQGRWPDARRKRRPKAERAARPTPTLRAVGATSRRCPPTSPRRWKPTSWW